MLTYRGKYNSANVMIDEVESTLVQQDDYIRNNIPSGFKVRKEMIADIIKENFDLLVVVEVICDEIGLDYSKVLKSIGTLGGGNHFIELNKDPDKNIWLTIHSGSRNFGLQVAQYHQKKAKELMRKMFIGDAFKGLEFLPLDEGGKKYLEDMKVAQKYAELNRQEIAIQLIDEFFGGAEAVDVVKTTHNYINFKDNIIRKGAISAHKDERLLIPLNMKDGVIVGKGKGNKKWNCSAPHGAGRVLSRKKAKEKIKLSDVEHQMEMAGVFTKSVNKNTLDEAPGAYKDSQLIIDSLEESVEIEFVMKPIYNFKAS